METGSNSKSWLLWVSERVYKEFSKWLTYYRFSTMCSYSESKYDHSSFSPKWCQLLSIGPVYSKIIGTVYSKINHLDF